MRRHKIKPFLKEHKSLKEYYALTYSYSDAWRCTKCKLTGDTPDEAQAHLDHVKRIKAMNKMTSKDIEAQVVATLAVLGFVMYVAFLVWVVRVA